MPGKPPDIFQAQAVAEPIRDCSGAQIVRPLLFRYPALAAQNTIIPSEVTENTQWTNRVELADINGDGRVDLLFANGSGYSKPGIGNLEVGDVDNDGDLDLILADWGAGDSMTNVGGRTMLWINKGSRL